MVFATVGGELHGRVIVTVRYGLEQAVAAPGLSAVDTVENAVLLFNGHGKTDGGRIERTRHEASHIHVAGIERTGLWHHNRRKGIVNDGSIGTITAIQGGNHHNLIAYVPIPDIDTAVGIHTQIAMTVETHQGAVAEHIHLIPCERSVQGGLGTVYRHDGTQLLRSAFANPARTVDLDTDILSRQHGNGGAYALGMGLFGTNLLDQFGCVGYREGKRIGARLQGAERNFVAVGRKYGGIQLGRYIPQQVHGRIFKPARDKGFVLGHSIRTDGAGSVDGGRDKAGIGNANLHITLGAATVAVDNRYRIACG